MLNFTLLLLLLLLLLLSLLLLLLLLLLSLLDIRALLMAGKTREDNFLTETNLISLILYHTL